jgi:hypothetical protein
MSESDSGELIGGLMGALIVIVVAAMAVVCAVVVTMTVGSLFGAGTALRNYGLAFANNVKPARASA